MPHIADHTMVDTGLASPCSPVVNVGFERHDSQTVTHMGWQWATARPVFRAVAGGNHRPAVRQFVAVQLTFQQETCGTVEDALVTLR